MKPLLAAMMGLAIAVSAKADLLTLWITPTNSTVVQTNIYIPANVEVKIVSAYISSGAALIVSKGTGTATLSSSGGNMTCTPTLVGPATLTLSGAGSVASFLTVDTNSLCAPPSCIPSTAVVIPDDTNGPVNIILESSTDLLNWTPALPGTYGTTSSNRFFRVRATR